MRRFPVFLFVIALANSACVEDQAPVSEAAHSYLSARLTGDFVTAGEFVTEASRDRLEDLELLVLTESAERFAGEFEVGKVTMEGDEALVAYTLKGYGDDTLALKKDGEFWRVDLTHPAAVPDAGVLWQELHALEEVDTIMNREVEALDNMLLNEDSLMEEFDLSAFEEDTTL